MIKETKVGELVIVAQTTYYVYKNKEKREKDEFSICTSDVRVINDIIKKNKFNLKNIISKILK